MIASFFYLKKSMLNFQRVIHAEYLTDVKKLVNGKLGLDFTARKAVSLEEAVASLV